MTYNTQNEKLIAYLSLDPSSKPLTEKLALSKLEIKNLRARICELRQMGFKQIITCKKKNSKNQTFYKFQKCV